MTSSLTVIIGGTGSIGAACAEEFAYRRRDTEVIILGRSSDPSIDLFSEQSISEAAARVASRRLPVSVILVATGILHTDSVQPEKTWKQINQPALDTLFRVNAIGPMSVSYTHLTLPTKRIV